MTVSCLLASDLQREKWGARQRDKQRQRRRNKCNKAILTKNNILRSLNDVLVKKANCSLSPLFLDAHTKAASQIWRPCSFPLCSRGFVPHPYLILSCFSLGSVTHDVACLIHLLKFFYPSCLTSTENSVKTRATTHAHTSLPCTDTYACTHRCSLAMKIMFSYLYIPYVADKFRQPC